VSAIQPVIQLAALPAFTDNYIWMLHDGENAVVVDPGQAEPVIEALDAAGLRLAAILVTHHHADHVGGVDALRSRLEARPVYGPALESIPRPFTPLREGDAIELFGLHFRVIDVPGHTAGHIAYFQTSTSGEGPLAAPILFCGDTLFSAGCGRVFEGTPAQMYRSLQKLDALPAATRVCCTHEYTLANLRFAAAVEPENAQIAEYLEACRATREAGRPTLPSTLDRERRINPFLRCAEPAAVAAARQQGAASDEPVAVFGALREWKNRFR
jgi:hydroxyacylglutathione hydrolase